MFPCGVKEILVRIGSPLGDDDHSMATLAVRRCTSLLIDHVQKQCLSLQRSLLAEVLQGLRDIAITYLGLQMAILLDCLHACALQ